MDNQVTELLRRHAELESRNRDGDHGDFLSGWQCENPWIEVINARVMAEYDALDPARYHYLDEDTVIAERVRLFHQMAGEPDPQEIVCGVGASALIFTFCAWLRDQGIDEVYYLRPMYFTFHKALGLLDIRTRPLSGRQPFEEHFTCNLPDSPSVLVISDPVWYAGIPLAHDFIVRLRDWQRATNSLILVDGSFQYFRWDGRLQENTAFLDSNLTLRIICPTKALAAHGYRFAYVLLPTALAGSFAEIYSNAYASSGRESLAFGLAGPLLLAERAVSDGLSGLASKRHQLLRETNRIIADWTPSCGYFTFERISSEFVFPPTLMDGSFFENRRYRDFYRINLLSPSLKMFGNDLDTSRFI